MIFQSPFGVGSLEISIMFDIFKVSKMHRSRKLPIFPVRLMLTNALIRDKNAINPGFLGLVQQNFPE